MWNVSYMGFDRGRYDKMHLFKFQILHSSIKGDRSHIINEKSTELSEFMMVHGMKFKLHEIVTNMSSAIYVYIKEDDDSIKFKIAKL